MKRMSINAKFPFASENVDTSHCQAFENLANYIYPHKVISMVHGVKSHKFHMVQYQNSNIESCQAENIEIKTILPCIQAMKSNHVP